MKRFPALLLAILLLCGSALADAYVIHQPREGQLTEQQAVAAASAWLAARFDLPEDAFVPYHERGGEKTFGPGWQWNAPTEDDCWCVVFSSTGDLPVGWAMLTLDGATGETLYWQYRVKADNVTYILAEPTADQLSLDDVRALIAERLSTEIDGEAATFDLSGTFGSEPRDPLLTAQPDYPDVTNPLWRMVAWYPADNTDCELVAYADIDAATGELLAWHVSLN